MFRWGRQPRSREGYFYMATDIQVKFKIPILQFAEIYANSENNHGKIVMFDKSGSEIPIEYIDLVKLQTDIDKFLNLYSQFFELPNPF